MKTVKAEIVDENGKRLGFINIQLNKQEFKKYLGTSIPDVPLQIEARIVRKEK